MQFIDTNSLFSPAFLDPENASNFCSESENMVPNRENGLNKDSCCMYLIVFAPPDKTRAPKKMEVWGYYVYF